MLIDAILPYFDSFFYLIYYSTVSFSVSISGFWGFGVLGFWGKFAKMAGEGFGHFLFAGHFRKCVIFRWGNGLGARKWVNYLTRGLVEGL